MRGLRLIGGLFALGALGGLLYLGELAWTRGISTAEAQVSPSCGPGRTCTVSKLKATATGGATAIQIPSASILSFDGATAGHKILYNNASGRIEYTAGAQYHQFDTTVVAAAASGSNSFQVLTTGSRVDFGAGSTDYCTSDGTNVVCSNIAAGVSASKDAFDFASITAGACSETTATAASDVAAGDLCLVAGTGTYVTGLILTCFVSDAATDTLTIRACCNNAAVACDPASQNFKLRVLKQ